MRTGRIPDRWDRGWGAVAVFGFGVDPADLHLKTLLSPIVRRRGIILCKRIGLHPSDEDLSLGTPDPGAKARVGVLW